MTDSTLVLPFHGILSITCSKCTKQGHFDGKDRTEAAGKAKAKGWSSTEEGRFNCPRCSSVFGPKRAR